MGDREQLLTALREQLGKTQEDLDAVEQQLSGSAHAAYRRRTLTDRQQRLRGLRDQLAGLIDQAKPRTSLVR